MYSTVLFFFLTNPHCLIFILSAAFNRLICLLPSFLLLQHPTCPSSFIIHLHLSSSFITHHIFPSSILTLPSSPTMSSSSLPFIPLFYLFSLPGISSHEPNSLVRTNKCTAFVCTPLYVFLPQPNHCLTQPHSFPVTRTPSFLPSPSHSFFLATFLLHLFHSSFAVPSFPLPVIHSFLSSLYLPYNFSFAIFILLLPFLSFFLHLHFLSTFSLLFISSFLFLSPFISYFLLSLSVHRDFLILFFLSFQTFSLATFLTSFL